MPKRSNGQGAHLGSVALCLAFALGCASSPRAPEAERLSGEPPTPDGLYRVETFRVARAWLKPGVSLAAYDAVMIAPVTVSYRSADRSSSSGRRRGNQQLSPEAMERFKRIFQETFESVLSRSRHFEIASEPGEKVLLVSGHILDLVVNVPEDRGNELSYVFNAGAMTLLLNVNDSQTGAPLARAADRRAITPAGANISRAYRSHPVNHWGAVRDVFGEWALILREALEELHAAPEVPLPG
ncbi:MAG: DUF3313 family protein [Myxococcota bacterium]